MITDNKSVNNYSLINLIVPVNSPATQFNFADQPQLRGKKIERLVLYSDTVVSKNQDGVASFPATYFSAYWLVIYYNQHENFRLPLWHLCNHLYGGGGASITDYVNSNGYIPLNDVNIIWEKSYIKGYGALSPGENLSLNIGVYYKD